MNLTQAQLGQIEHEVLKYPPHVVERYYDMVANGQNPRFALMAACQQAPMTGNTDRTFNAERRALMDSMHPKQRAAYLNMAKQVGISTAGKYYVGALGRPTDPMAWVSTVDDAKDVCKAKNLTASGLVNHKGHEATYKKVRMAKDISDRLVREKLASDPSLAAKCAKDPQKLHRVQAEVVDRHAPAGTS